MSYRDRIWFPIFPEVPAIIQITVLLPQTRQRGAARLSPFSFERYRNLGLAALLSCAEVGTLDVLGSLLVPPSLGSLQTLSAVSQEPGRVFGANAREFARSGETLIVWKLDRLARSMKQLIETIENLRVRGIGF